MVHLSTLFHVRCQASSTNPTDDRWFGTERSDAEPLRIRQPKAVMDGRGET